MFESKRSILPVTVHLFVAFACLFCIVDQCRAEVPEGLEDIWDPAKYIGLDEIEPGMEAYCLTEYGVAGIEKFDMRVIDVVRNVSPGKDAVMVEGMDERFIETGPVAGCSGSPVYIDGRLAGALAFTWPFAKDPLYGATPIGEMLMIGRGGRVENHESDLSRIGLSYDFTGPIDLAEVDRQLRNAAVRTGRGVAGINRLPCPILAAGFPSEVAEQLKEVFGPMGFTVVAGAGSGNDNAPEGKSTQLAPGASLAVPLVSGDISLSTYGTVTDVVDDKVYGFGHSLLGYGQVDLPIATAKVHTVVSTISSSFKLASVLDTVGSLEIDESAGIIGRIGGTARIIPLTIRVDRFNDMQVRVYDCRLAYNRLLTPLYLRATLIGAAVQLGDFPPDHTLEYKVAICLEGGRSINFENVSTGMGLNELIIESISSVGLLMNNPYDRVGIESLDFDMRIMPENIISHIWSAKLSDSKVKAGQNVDVEVVLESVLAGKKKYIHTVEIPEDLAPGKYQLTVSGSRDYERFLVKAAPYRFIAQNVSQLIDALNDSLKIDRDSLYFLLTLPPDGVTVEKAELPDLPATRALLMRDAKRTLRVLPHSHWIEHSFKVGSVVIDKKTFSITVEK